jgi:uncharacterized membrane protein YhfC
MFHVKQVRDPGQAAAAALRREAWGQEAESMDIALRALNGLLMIALPLVLGAVLVRRLRLPWGLFGAGALTFLASQVGHLPFNLWVLTPVLNRLDLGHEAGAGGLVTMAVLLGLSAGVFEEGARILAYRYLIRRSRTWEEAVLFGAGHGGVEAILFGGVALVGLAQAIAYRGLDLAQILPPDRAAAAQAQLAAYWGGPWYMSLLGAVERASALCIQIALAVLVLQAFVRRRPAWAVAAVGWHTLVDAGALLALQAWGAVATEGLVALLALASLGMIAALRPTPPHLPAEAIVPAGESRPTGGLPARGSMDDDDLDSSRFLG